MSQVSVELRERCYCGGSCVISIKCRSRGPGWGFARCILYVWGGRQERVVGNGTTAQRPGSGLSPLCQIRAAKPGQTELVEAERGQRHPDMLLCGVVLLLLRAGLGQCRARTRDAIPGLRHTLGHCSCSPHQRQLRLVLVPNSLLQEQQHRVSGRHHFV